MDVALGPLIITNKVYHSISLLNIFIWCQFHGHEQYNISGPSLYHRKQRQVKPNNIHLFVVIELWKTVI